MKKHSTPLVGEILQKIAPQIGAIVMMEPEWGIAGQIIYQSGQKRYFRYSSLDLNRLGSCEIAKDKDYANFFMKCMGYPTIEGKTFFKKEWADTIESPRDINAAYAYAQTIGFPVIVKPNSGSQGKGVALVHTKREFYRAMYVVFKQDRVALVQRPVAGNDYRIVVLDDKVISAYQRVPLSVVGDGASTIEELIKTKQDAFVGASRDTTIKLDDPRIADKLRRGRMTMQSVPRGGVRVFLLDNANLSSGGDSVDVTEVLHSGFKERAIALTKDMGLRLCGVDLMVEGDISSAPETYWILEINSAPGLDHYARSGDAQKRIVEQLYLEVLKSMEQ